jgi:lipopolysaccharide export system protein LptC
MIKKLSTNTFSAALAITATIAFFFWVFSEDDGQATMQADSSTATPEWYWDNALFWSFDDEGRLEQDATASDAKYFSKEDTIYLRNPRISTHSGEDSTWYTRSDFAEVRQDNDIVELSQNVEIRKASGEVTIRTERLTLIRSENMAETDVAVSIIGETGSTDAVGMRAWLKEGKVELLSKVNTTHEPY